MANIDVTLKRYNGSSNDIILPTTTLTQVYTDSTLGTTLNSYLDSTFVKSNLLGAVNGVATLGTSGKVPYAQLPQETFGGLNYLTTKSTTGITTLDDIMTEFETHLGVTLTSSNVEIYSGSFITITGASKSVPEGTTADWSADIVEEGGDSPSTVTLEQGDMVILTSEWNAGSGEPYFGVVNQTYADASVGVKGVVTLSDPSTVLNLGDLHTSAVITENGLEQLVDPSSDLSPTTTTDLIARADHGHDGRYYQKSEISSFFSGSTGITGYNKSNWDTAYGWGNHALEGYLTTETDPVFNAHTVSDIVDGTGFLKNNGAGVWSYDNNTYLTGNQTITLTGDVSGSGSTSINVTVQNDSHTHDTRYYTETEMDNFLDGSASLNGQNFIPIVYGATPSSTVAGAILIDID